MRTQVVGMYPIALFNVAGRLADDLTVFDNEVALRNVTKGDFVTLNR